MQLDGGLGLTKTCPRKDTQAEVDGGGVQCVGGLFQFHRELIAGIELSGYLNQVHREIGVDVPIARFVGVGKCTACDTASNAKMIKFGLVNAQTSFDVAWVLAIG